LWINQLRTLPPEILDLNLEIKPKSSTEAKGNDVKIT